jgi:hypothetical protein
MSAEVDSCLVLLDATSGMYYSLNAVGLRLWTMSSRGATLGDIVDTLLLEYVVERDVLWRDLESLISELRQNALLEVLPSAE